MNINNNPNGINTFNAPGTTSHPAGAPTQQVNVTRELSGVTDGGILGEQMTEGTDHLADANKFFAMQKFAISGLLVENNQAVGQQAVISESITANPKTVLGADDMYVAGDPGVGGKGNNYAYNHINVTPGYYTMLSTGLDGGQKMTVNAHVEQINTKGDKAFTEYGFVVKDQQGLKTQATLSGGQLTIVDANGQTRKLLPPNDTYTVGNPNDPVAKFYYADVPGAGENGASEKRLMVDYFEKPSQATTDDLVAKGADPAEVAKLRSKTTMSYGFRVPDGVNTFASSEGVGAGAAMKTTTNNVKTYYDSHYGQSGTQVITLCPPAPPTPPYPPTPPTPPTPPYPPTPPTPPTPPYPPTPPVAANEHGRVWGDPHVNDPDGGKFNFQETGIYNVLKDKNVALNVKMVAGPGTATFNGEAGLVVGNRTVKVNPDGTTTIGYTDPNITTPPINLAKGQTVVLGNGSSITRNENKIVVNTDEYKIQFDTGLLYKGQTYTDIDVWSKAGGVMSDGVAPTGLLGDLFDTDSTAATAAKKAAEAYKETSLLDLDNAPPVPATPRVIVEPEPPTPPPVVIVDPPPPTVPTTPAPGSLQEIQAMLQKFMQQLMQFFLGLQK